MSRIKKNSLLLVGFVLLFILACKFSFLKTIEIKKQYHLLLEQTGQKISSDNDLHYLRKQHKYYDSILVKHQIFSKTTFHNKLLITLNEICKIKTLKLLKFEKPLVLEINKNAIQETYQFSVQGSYIDIVSLIFKLEQELKMGKIASVSFEKKKNFKKAKEFLECKIYLQKTATILYSQ